MTTPTDPTDCLKLVALDEDDLAVLSAHLQDALVPVADMAYLPKDRRFALAGRRFDWVKAGSGGCERRAAGLHFDCVTHAALSGFARDDDERVLNLLAIAFEAGETPGGTIRLTFSGGAAVRLSVECIEAQMRDLGPRWSCGAQPSHAIEADG